MRKITIFGLAIFLMASLLLQACGETITYGTTSANEKNTNNGEESKQTTASGTESANIPAVKDYMPNQHKYVKAMWISQFDLNGILLNGGTQRSAAELKTYAKTMMENCASIGVNTVFIQVRPNADSFYPSGYYPPSRYAVGSYGKSFSYDPFVILIEAAKEQNFSVHAWINPMRCMTAAEILAVPSGYKIAKWYKDSEYNGKYIVNVNGTYYLNPAYEEVRNLISEGAAEILENYDVDGIHIDDYFYPSAATANFDSPAYAQYTGGMSLADFRRECINMLVRQLYLTTKSFGNGFLFGISPGGNTNTNYNTLYADVAKWVSADGYCDYIIPQVYFGLEHGSHDFKKVCAEFAAMVTNKNIKLIIGITLSKASSGYSGGEDQWAGTGKREWIENKDVIARCLQFLETINSCGGVSLFSYHVLYSVTTGNMTVNLIEEASVFLPIFNKMG